ncbi:hypothetical protein BDK51DRAFT_31978 [Blyttiomyces helicus]|uniref:Uncharacterized protein n=1 Tax=Blyttiomyces helicus TaxID=388810 RepID=A0A4P9WDK2_9FUNG|nr:hypothetical protein BDK51DRAFT_31978 [Blyttiomyces helicus]|eukprot:RKO90432.1 hypothetical protein BDK51DRAFT_31978 [Blyttiomyces helicus]
MHEGGGVEDVGEANAGRGNVGCKSTGDNAILARAQLRKSKPYLAPADRPKGGCRRVDRSAALRSTRLVPNLALSPVDLHPTSRQSKVIEKNAWWEDGSPEKLVLGSIVCKDIWDRQLTIPIWIRSSAPSPPFPIPRNLLLTYMSIYLCWSKISVDRPPPSPQFSSSATLR